MRASSRWALSSAEKGRLIKNLTSNLPLLRAKLDVSQEEVAGIIGISRQTYSAVENGKRPMSWQIYLSLVLFFDINEETSDLLHHLECFPIEMVSEKHQKEQVEKAADTDILHMLEKLDDRAMQSVKTVLMVEYARCSKIPGEAVIKAFDGSEFSRSISPQDTELAKAIDRIKNSSEDK